MTPKTITGEDFFALFRIAYNEADGQELSRLLNMRISSTSAIPNGTLLVHEFLYDWYTYNANVGTAAGLEALCGAFRKWCELSEEMEEALPAVRRLASVLRQEAIANDDRDGTRKWTKKCVEVLRECFPKFHRDRDRFATTSSIACEIVRGYLRLDQPSLCLPVMSTLEQGGPFDPYRVPKSVACTLLVFWSIVLISKGQSKEAADKLAWAACHCKYVSPRNYQRIMEYLVPCQMSKGVFPQKRLLMLAGLYQYAGICRAISSGNIKLFNNELAENMEHFISSGTFMLVEKLKLACYRSLVKKIIMIISPESCAFKIDLNIVESVISSQVDMDKEQFITIMTNLISIGAIKGYMSYEHYKLVLSKNDAFPVITNWGHF